MRSERHFSDTLIKIAYILFLWALVAGTVHSQSNLVGFNTIPKRGTILIYAHLDDDLIWMLPFWPITEKFIGGAMPTTPSYNTIIRQQQAFLDNRGYGIDYESNWFTPWDPISDTEYSQYYLANNPAYSYLVLDHLEARLYNDPSELSQYEINKIKAKLEQYIASPDMSRVVTHNNWGEYGHKHHKALNKAVRELAVKYRKDVWMLGCDNGGFRDVNVPPGIRYTMGSFNDPDLYTGIRTIYQNNRRWTWYSDRIPSGDHKFIEIVDAGTDKSDILTGERITRSGPYQDEPGAYIFDGTDDYLTLRGNNNSSFTIAMRIRPDRIREMDIACMAEYPLSGRNDRNLYLNGDGRITARIFDGSSRTVRSDRNVSAGQWSHIAITGDGRSLKIFINGVPDRTVSTGTAITNYSTPEFILGQATITDSYFRGQISDVRLYNYVLSDSRIAEISGARFRITANAGEGGSINPAGTVMVNVGDDYTFTINPHQGFMIEDVKVNNQSVGAVSSYIFRSITSDHSIMATFRPQVFTVGGIAGPGGSITPTGAINVNYGSNRTFTIVPDYGYHITDVLVDGFSVGSISEFTFSNITSNHTISAVFSINTYAITVNSATGGSVNPSGTVIVEHGMDQTFKIEPEDGYQIADVLVDGISAGSLSEYSFKDISGNHTLSVLFTKTYRISSSSGFGGSVSPSGTVIVSEGDFLTINIIPDRGFRIQDVLVDNHSLGDLDEYTFEGISSDHSINAYFTTGIKAGIYPNPFQEKLNLEIKSPGEYQFELYIESLTNKTVYRLTDIPGNSLTQLNLNLTPGLYILKLYLKGVNVMTKKIIRD